MLQSKSNAARIMSIAIAAVFLFVSIIASTQSVSAATKLKVTVTGKTVYVGQTAKLKANKNVKWSVSNKKIAKLTNVKKKTVTIKGLKAGTVYVKAKSGKTTKKIKIVVKNKGPEKINLVSTRDYIGIGEDCAVFVDSVEPSGVSSEVVFSSNNKSVAVVSQSGLVTGVSEGEATITAKSKSNSTKASVTLTVVAAKAGVLTAAIDMTDVEKYPAGKAVKAWFEVPVSDENQTIGKPKYEAESATYSGEVTDSSGAKAFYIEWGPEVAPENRKATLSFHVYRRAVLNKKDLSNYKDEVNTEDEELMKWCKQTEYSGSLTEGIVKETSDRIINDAKAVTVYDKAHAIYLWVCENITRDKSMPNRELGDVVTILSSEEKIAGSCIDINSIFVALCNAQGIPARESFGYKIYEGSSSDEKTKLGQNCRAEFYLPGYGWVEVDPAMPLGRVMNGAVEKGTPEWEAAKETYWTSGSPDWICQNHGRDLTFESPAEMNAAPGYMVNPDGKLNHFMFPHGEYEGRLIPGWGSFASEFKYVYTFKEESLIDCGC